MSPSFVVTPSAIEDHAACAALFAQLEIPDPVWTEEEFAARVVPDASTLRDGERVVGYAWGRRRGDALHVVHVVVDPSYRGRGAGRALMRALAARGRAMGLSRWLLNVKPDNVTARALYERCGMSVRFASASIRISWSSVAKLEARPGLVARELEPEDDSAFERACGLGDGEVATLREQGRIVLGVSTSELGAAAMGAYEPRFPSLSPVRAPHPVYVRSILDRARLYALPEQPDLRVFAEDDAALEAELVRAGGEVLLRALRMEGQLP